MGDQQLNNNRCFSVVCRVGKLGTENGAQFSETMKAQIKLPPGLKLGMLISHLVSTSDVILLHWKSLGKENRDTKMDWVN